MRVSKVVCLSHQRDLTTVLVIREHLIYECKVIQSYIFANYIHDEVLRKSRSNRVHPQILHV